MLLDGESETSTLFCCDTTSFSGNKWGVGAGMRHEFEQGMTMTRAETRHRRHGFLQLNRVGEISQGGDIDARRACEV